MTMATAKAMTISDYRLPYTGAVRGYCHNLLFNGEHLPPHGNDDPVEIFEALQAESRRWEEVQEPARRLLHRTPGLQRRLGESLKRLSQHLLGVAHAEGYAYLLWEIRCARSYVRIETPAQLLCWCNCLLFAGSLVERTFRMFRVTLNSNDLMGMELIDEMRRGLQLNNCTVTW
jgi:hypothetical protein